MSKSPSPSQLEEWKNFGLFITEDPDNKPLTFSQDWSQSKIDKWLRKILPEPFQYMDIANPVHMSGNMSYHWRVLTKERQCLVACSGTKVDGDLLDRVKGTSGKSWRHCMVRLGSSDIAFIWPGLFLPSSLQLLRLRYHGLYMQTGKGLSKAFKMASICQCLKTNRSSRSPGLKSGKSLFAFELA